jgi:hypothetical protein
MALHLIQGTQLNKSDRLPQGREESTVCQIVFAWCQETVFYPLQIGAESNSMFPGPELKNLI